MASAGDKIHGFTLVRQLGAGGMGETWEAVRHVGADFEQRVAIKIVSPEALRSTEGLSLFRREASLAASLRHPNIASVLDVDEQRGSIVCELVDGANLRAVLRACFRGRLAAPLVVYLMGQIARGLSHAHRRVWQGTLSPVVHRDMSPGNIVVDYDGNPKIVDFGIAKAIASADISETIKGKLSYMAPEQAMATRIDGRCDQYALGVMAYEALSGIRPNDGRHDGETLANILSGKRVPLAMREPSLPPDLARTIERMLSLHPEQRFPSMEAVVEALDPFTPPLSIHRELAKLVVRARPLGRVTDENGQLAEQVSESLVPDAGAAVQTVSDSAARTPSSRRLKSDPGPLIASEAFRHAELGAGRTDTLIAPNVAGARPDLPVRDEPMRPKPRVARTRWIWAAAGTTLFAAAVVILTQSDPSDAAPQVVPAAATPPASSSPGASGVRQAHASSTSSTVTAPSIAPDLPLPRSVEETQAPSAPALPPAEEPRTSASAAQLDPAGIAANTGRVRRGARERERDRGDKERDRGDKERERDTSPPAPASSSRSAKVRVKVFPWGRVWVDGKLQGSVPPILDVSLTPGPHEIAVGHERPVQTRSVNLEAAATQLVAFDLEGTE